MPLRLLPLWLTLFSLSAPCLTPPAVRAAPAATDYAHAPAMRLRHWPRFPVRVFLATHGAEEAREAGYAQAGFDVWVRASGNAVRYVVVDAPAQADLTVRFAPEATLPGEAGAVGVTTVYSRESTLVRAEMRLATGEATREDIVSTAAHEFGHALGIQGHSDSPDDLMFPTETRFFSADGERLLTPDRPVTARDLNTLRACYPLLLKPPAP